VPDEIYERVSAQFGEADLVALTFAVVVINSWNRLAISLRPPVGAISRGQWRSSGRAVVAVLDAPGAPSRLLVL
jgi:hypothetical protein